MFVTLGTTMLAFAEVPDTLDPVVERGTSKIDQILPSSSPSSKYDDKQKLPLPTKNLKTQVIPRVINLALGLTATAGMGIFVYAGVMLIIAQGNEEDVTKFKNILLWSLVGLAFISAAYALVQGIMKLVLK